MTLPMNKASPPLKTMDIKTAFLSAGRKRKAPSPQVSKSDVKIIKLNKEHADNESDMEILDDACGVTVTLDKSALNLSAGDCKENKDINATENLESSVRGVQQDKDCNAAKEELSSCVNKSSVEERLISQSSPKSIENDSDQDLEPSLSEKSDSSSCDELSSAVNSSVNASMNTSGIVTGDDGEEDNANSDLKVTKNVSDNKGDEKAETDDARKAKKKKMTPAEAKKRAEEREQKQKERKMTPAEAKKKAEEREQKQKERMLKKQELENKKKERLLEKERRQKERLIRKEREEFERKERERVKQEKKEQEEKEKLQRQKEKEEKLKIKNMILEQKLEEKRKKEEQRQKREEEMKKAEEEKLRIKLEKEQKEKEKKERAKAAFMKFFQKPETQPSLPTSQVTEKEGAFKPFQVSDDMTLAPVVPPAAQERFDKKQLDHCLVHQDGKELYLQILKSGSYKDVRQRKRNRKLASSEADVIVIEKSDEAELKLCPKLLQFSENVRPPYWGTWRKKSKNIRPRNPFGHDEIFDYTADSDDEWDEGGPGESLSGTENEDESEDEYEVDNEFFVPHGYLSDEEEKKEDDDEEVMDPEKQKALLKVKMQEFEMERKKKTTVLKPIVLGCYFVNDPNFQDSGLLKCLETFSAEFLTDTPIPTRFTVKNLQSESGSNTAESPKSSNSGNLSKKKRNFPEEAFPQLIRLVHGNTKNQRILAEEFYKFWVEQVGDTSSEVKQNGIKSLSSSEVEPLKDAASEQPSDSSQITVRLCQVTIKTIAAYGKCPDSSFNKFCWWVHDSIREKYGLMDAPIPNQWHYVSDKCAEKESSGKNNSTSIKEFLSQN